MLNTVTVDSKYTTTPLVLDLWSYSNGYFVKSIDGLGPVDSSVSIFNNAIGDGGVYKNSRRGTRNIVITLNLVPTGSKTIEDLRKDLYVWFGAGASLKLTFSDSLWTSTRYIEGYVERATPSIFEDKSTFEISIICPSPAFISSSSTTRTPSYAQLKAGYIINNPGTDPGGSGFNLKVRLGSEDMADAEWKAVSSLNPDGSSLFTFRNEKIDNGLNYLVSNTTYEINTVPGSRSFSKIASGVTTSVINWITANTRWPMFYSGTNVLYGYDTGGMSTAPTYSIVFTPRYGEI